MGDGLRYSLVPCAGEETPSGSSGDLQQDGGEGDDELMESPTSLVFSWGHLEEFHDALGGGQLVERCPERWKQTQRIKRSQTLRRSRGPAEDLSSSLTSQLRKIK